MKYTFLVPLFLVCVIGTNAMAQNAVIIENHSSWEITQIYISTVDDEIWFDDLTIRGNIDSKLAAYTNSSEDADRITISLRAGCQNYDIKVVNNLGVRCFIKDKWLCGDTVFKLTDILLALCI